MGKFDPFPDARPSTEIPATHGLSRGTTGVAAILASESANIGSVAGNVDQWLPCPNRAIIESDRMLVFRYLSGEIPPIDR
jgi:hypothetical protein